MDKTSFKIFVVALIFSLLIFGGLFIYALNMETKEEIEVEYVTNPTMFFTVENCVNRYIGLIVAKDSESLYNVIDEKYKIDNGITVNNVLANVKHLSNNYSFVSDKMLEDKKESYKYYVRGYLIEEIYDENNFNSNKEEFGLIVKLDVVNNTYSIIPSEVGEYFDAL